VRMEWSVVSGKIWGEEGVKMFLNLAQKRLTTTFAIVSLLGTQPSSVVASLVARFHFFLSDFGQVTPSPHPSWKICPRE